jgi:CheY-like chemotaxis protein
VIRKLKAIRPAPGIAISGFGRDEDIRRSLVAGFSAHLVKPVAFNELQDVVQQLLIRA